MVNDLPRLADYQPPIGGIDPWRDVMADPNNYQVIPQVKYRPHTRTDRQRYVEAVELQEPIYFYTHKFGIRLSDALHSRVLRLQSRDETVFHGLGPSVTIRLEVRS